MRSELVLSDVATSLGHQEALNLIRAEQIESTAAVSLTHNAEITARIALRAAAESHRSVQLAELVAMRTHQATLESLLTQKDAEMDSTRSEHLLSDATTSLAHQVAMMLINSEQIESTVAASPTHKAEMTALTALHARAESHRQAQRAELDVMHTHQVTLESLLTIKDASMDLMRLEQLRSDAATSRGREGAIRLVPAQEIKSTAAVCLIHRNEMIALTAFHATAESHLPAQRAERAAMRTHQVTLESRLTDKDVAMDVMVRALTGKSGSFL
jgi:hypothetical protein